MQDWQLRVVEERNELRERLDKLESYLFARRDAGISFTALYYLVKQRDAMTEYLKILEARIAMFN